MMHESNCHGKKKLCLGGGLIANQARWDVEYLLKALSHKCAAVQGNRIMQNIAVC